MVSPPLDGTSISLSDETTSAVNRPPGSANASLILPITDGSAGLSDNGEGRIMDHISLDGLWRGGITKSHEALSPWIKLRDETRIIHEDDVNYLLNT